MGTPFGLSDGTNTGLWEGDPDELTGAPLGLSDGDSDTTGALDGLLLLATGDPEGDIDGVIPHTPYPT